MTAKRAGCVELVRFGTEDVAELVAWLADPATAACAVPDWPTPVTPLVVRRAYFGTPHGLSLFCALRDGARVGHAGLRVMDRAVGHLCHVVVDPRARRQGCGSAIVRGLNRLAFDQLGLHRLQLYVFTENLAAVSCYAAAGFQVEGTHRQHLRLGDRHADTYTMALLREDWLARPHEG